MYFASALLIVAAALAILLFRRRRHTSLIDGFLSRQWVMDHERPKS